LAALAQANLITYAVQAPQPIFDWRRDVSSPQNCQEPPLCLSLLARTAGKSVQAGPFVCEHAYAPQTLSSPIWGSNISLLTHMDGTPIIPNIEGGILFIEEIDEEPYAIRRQFYQLFHAGILQKTESTLFWRILPIVSRPQAALLTPWRMPIDTLRSTATLSGVDRAAVRPCCQN
jgi:muramoyltetrapeptide carboxypeptidase